MESSTFTIRCPDNMETNWSIQLYPKGAEEDSSDFLSIFLQSETEDIDIDAKCNFSILDVSKIKRNKKVGEWDRYDEVRAYYGFDEFIRIDSLGSKAARLLPNDSLTIVCDVTVLFVPEAKAGADAASIDKEANDGTKTLFDETKAILDETKSKLCLMETKLEELQITNNNNDFKMKKPPCPVCFEEMSYNTKIAQCINGHHLCWNCKEKMMKNDCPSCGQPVDGRAFGMESYLTSIFGLQ